MTAEQLAALQLDIAADNMHAAASALDDLTIPESRQHANELRGAAKMAREWAKELRRIAK